MSVRYVVLVKPPDDHPGAVRAMGSFTDYARAEKLRDKIRTQCDLLASLGDETEGYAYIVPLERPRVRDAIRWATKGAR